MGDVRDDPEVVDFIFLRRKTVVPCSPENLDLSNLWDFNLNVEREREAERDALANDTETWIRYVRSATSVLHTHSLSLMHDERMQRLERES